jgi:hypothetical protein
MTPQDAIEYFGSRKELQKVCRVTPTAIHHWVKQGWIPYDKQCLLQIEAERSPRKRGRRIVATRSDLPKVQKAA